jgi:hypothetical protein
MTPKKRSPKKSGPKKAAGKKAVRKIAPRKAPARKKSVRPATPGILEPHAHRLREVVHSALASAGVHGLSLKSMHFANLSECPDGQHLGQTTIKHPDGTETVTYGCVPN